MDGISEAGKLTIKFAETDYLFLNLPGPENGFTWKLSDIKTDVEDSFREFYNYINRERIIVDIYLSDRMKIC